MILSGHLHHDRPAAAADCSRRAARLADIEARRRAAEAGIDALVVAWQGGVARHQGSHWESWDVAAHEAIDTLAALLGAIDLARAELADLDRGPTVPRQVERRALEPSGR